MFIGKRNILYRYSFVRILSIALFIASTIFLMFSLLSYSPEDISWFYYVTKHTAIHNWCGALGAHIAAVLFYLFGSASLLWILFFSYIVYFLACGNTDEWERIIFFVLLILTSAALLNFLAVDFLQSPYPGGYIGMHEIQWLSTFFNSFILKIFLHTMLIVFLILTLQFSFIGIIRAGTFGIYFVHNFLKQQKIYTYCKISMQSMFYFLMQPLKYSWQFLNQLRDGSAFDHVKLLVPDDQDTWILPEDAFQESATHTNESTSLSLSTFSTNNDFAKQSARKKEKTIPARVTKELIEETEVNEMQSMQNNETNTQSYRLPNLDIFIGVENEQDDHTLKSELEERAKILEEKLERFGVSGQVVAIKRGPVVTVFEYQPHIDTKLSKILALEDDLAMALRALSIRIIAPIPGRSVVGFEVANNNRIDVLFAHAVQSKEFSTFSGALPLILGQDTIGNEIVVDLARMPHLLIAGSTGSGKSVALNAMLISLLCARTPDELKLILIDPKRLEFASYADIAHLLFPIVAHPKQAILVLRWVVKQMEERYELMAKSNTRNIFDYNKYVKNTQAGESMPYIVVIIDELADLMMTAGREVEDLITRIAQMARASGIHMIVATQRPSVDVITGLIKVNFPSRISFRVTSRIDSRTILDCGGADKLLGRGDMLFLDSNAASLKRVHGAYVSDAEIEQVVDHIRAEQPVHYLDMSEEITHDISTLDDADDALYQEILGFLDSVDEVSISLLQRKFRIGYNRSARIIDMLEAQGHILPADGSKTRKVIKGV